MGVKSIWQSNSSRIFDQVFQPYFFRTKDFQPLFQTRVFDLISPFSTRCFNLLFWTRFFNLSFQPRFLNLSIMQFIFLWSCRTQIKSLLVLTFILQFIFLWSCRTQIKSLLVLGLSTFLSLFQYQDFRPLNIFFIKIHFAVYGRCSRTLMAAV